MPNAGNNLAGIAFGVRPEIFQIAFVTIPDEVDRHADRSAAIRQTISEPVDCLRLVVTGQPQPVSAKTFKKAQAGTRQLGIASAITSEDGQFAMAPGA
jgi:hypothetical protein